MTEDAVLSSWLCVISWFLALSVAESRSNSLHPQSASSCSLKYLILAEEDLLPTPPHLSVERKRDAMFDMSIKLENAVYMCKLVLFYEINNTVLSSSSILFTFGKVVMLRLNRFIKNSVIV